MKQFYIKMCCLYFNILQQDISPASREICLVEYRNYRAMYKLNKGK